MTTDINERIARLVERHPTFTNWNQTSDCGAWRFMVEGKKLVSPADFTESLDASMAVIQRRWESPRVTFDRGTFRRGSTWIAWIETRSKAETHKHGEADTPSHALAIALLAALEAETKP